MPGASGCEMVLEHLPTYWTAQLRRGPVKSTSINCLQKSSLFHPLNYTCLNVQNVCCVCWILHPQILSYVLLRALPLSPAASNLASGCRSANFREEASVEKLIPPPLSPGRCGKILNLDIDQSRSVQVITS